MQQAIQAENELAHTAIGLAIEIHKALGPGLTEDAYRDCLMYELKEHGIFAEAGKMMPVQYKNLQLDYGYMVDILVEGKLVVEIETVEQISDNQVQLLLRHLKTGGFKLGLIINFNSLLLKNGIRRVTNHRPAGEEEKSILEESVV